MDLLEWFDQNKRDLPWRRNPNSYQVWISEIMLQQTRVETVKDYYLNFMELFPDVESLAKADEEVVLKAWEGLGYYRRARNMHKTSQILLRDYGASLPDDEKELLKLPGIGKYTAAAILSIAFNQPYVACDANLYRIASRLTREEGFVEDTSSQKRMEAFLYRILDPSRPGDFNQALMDLASMICVVRGEILCSLCPLKDLCQAFQVGDMESFPRRKAKKKRRLEKRTVLLFENSSGIYLEKRPNSGLLANLWGLPTLLGHQSREDILERYQNILISLQRLRDYKHIFSHVEWDMIAYRLKIVDGVYDQLPGIFLNPRELDEKYSIPSAFKPFLEEEG